MAKNASPKWHANLRDFHEISLFQEIDPSFVAPLALLVAPALVVACSEESSDGDTPPAGEAQRKPPLTAQPTPKKGTDDAQSPGSPTPTAAPTTLSDAFGRSCAGCHGAQGQGGFGTRLSGTALSLTEFRETIREGAGRMPRINEGRYSEASLLNDYAVFTNSR